MLYEYSKIHLNMMEERKLYFNVSARTAKLIGLENFANAEGAIIELVKNSYDADAPFCAVIFDIKEMMKDSSVYIIDGGCGMDDTVIENQWMTIGTDDKLINSHSAALGRVKSGAKGIGRFALNRIGKESEMLTFPTDRHIGYDWNIDWSAFDKMGSTLSDVGATLREIDHIVLVDKLNDFGIQEIEVVKNEVYKEFFHGTIIKIKNLNDAWDEDALLQLYSNLELLIPSHLANNFKLYMFTLSDLSKFGKVSHIEYDDFDYKITAQYEGKASRKITVKLQRKELNLSLLETSYTGVFNMAAMREYPYRLEDFKLPYVEREIVIGDGVSEESLQKIGGFVFIFYFIKNTIKDDQDAKVEKKYPYNSINSPLRKKWLGKYRGVKIYRDEFRVRPYGDPSNDWLRLGERQSLSPGGAGQKMGGYRIRPNQISGSVFISRLENKAFEDKSSREGIMENDEFNLFQNLLKLVIEAFERDRNTIMYSLSQYYKERYKDEGRARDISEEIRQKDKTNDKSGTTENERILAEGYSSLENELSEKEAEIRMLRSLASSGIAVASFTHELQSLSKILIPRTDLLKGAMQSFIPEELANEKNKFENPYYLLRLIREDDIKLQQWLNYSLNAIRRNKRDKRDISMSEYFASFKNSWLNPLKQKNISIEVFPQETAETPYFNGYEMDLDSIFNNLVTNSVTSLLRTEESNKRIWINWRIENGFLKIDFLDNGLGLASEYRQYPDIIFDAFETSSKDKIGNKSGTGMGLFIVKGIIDSYADSSIVVMPVQNGFGMEIILKIK